jgi:hypothetical protein
MIRKENPEKILCPENDSGIRKIKHNTEIRPKTMIFCRRQNDVPLDF